MAGETRVGVGMGVREDKNRENMGQKQPPKSGLGDRQVGAFSVFRPGDTGIPFIFSRFWRFFRKNGRLRGWCNTGPGIPCFSSALVYYPLSLIYSGVVVWFSICLVWALFICLLLVCPVRCWLTTTRHNRTYSTTLIIYATPLLIHTQLLVTFLIYYYFIFHVVDDVVWVWIVVMMVLQLTGLIVLRWIYKHEV